MRRRVQIRVSASLLTAVATTGWAPDRPFSCIDGLPVGAVCIGVSWDPLRYEAVAVFEHPSFAEVDGIPPTLRPTYQTHES